MPDMCLLDALEFLVDQAVFFNDRRLKVPSLERLQIDRYLDSLIRVCETHPYLSPVYKSRLADEIRQGR